MGASAQERGEEACKVREEGEEGEKGEAGLRVAPTSATVNTTINLRGQRNKNARRRAPRDSDGGGGAGAGAAHRADRLRAEQEREWE